MEGHDMQKALRGARACRTLGRDVGAVGEMRALGVLTAVEAADLLARLEKACAALVASGDMNPHQAEKVAADLARERAQGAADANPR